MESPSPHTTREPLRLARTADPSSGKTLGTEFVCQPMSPFSELNVPALISLRAGETPEAVAITSAGQQVTYAELDARSSVLARHLCALGTGRDKVVGVCLERSIAFATCALAVLKACGGYVPMDPTLPRHRLALLLRDPGIDLVIATASSCPELTGATQRIVAVDAEGRAEDRNLPSVPRLTEAQPDDLAYVIYTSGSTGTPKGVEVAHRNLSNLVAWHRSTFDLTAADRASHLAGIGFDAAAWELWPYLSAGASVHIGHDLVSKDARGLRDWLLDNNITICFSIAPLAEQLMRLEWPAECPLRILLTGADTLHSYPGPQIPFRVVNNYGPTECTVVATSATVPPAGNFDHAPSIGCPIANAHIYILDEYGNPVPDGDAGEIWIGGRGVARGYRGRPDLTAAKFHLDPFDPTPGARMYASGDLGRALPNGEIQFLGRMDEQLKIRGLRIEPGEIESLLNQHPDVKQSAVVACQFAPDDIRLVAHLVLKSDRLPAPKELQSFLGSRLPQHAVPSCFVHLAELPLTLSGKIDRHALSWLSSGDLLSDHRYVGPRTAVEERLARIVGQLLKVEKVSMDDNFFLLGGHSLLGTQLIARARDAFGVDISLRYLFEFPTVAALAAEVERVIRASVEAVSDEDARRLLTEAHVLGPNGNGG